MREGKIKMLRIISIATFVISICSLAFCVEQSQFLWIISLFGLAFGSYYILLKFSKKGAWKGLLALGIAIRMIVAFSFPNLSDDIYRFFWDGHVFVQGNNPYSETPSEYYHQLERPPTAYESDLFEKMNSQEYYTVYPLLNQIVFTLVRVFGGNNLELSAVFLKLILVLCEGFTIALIIVLLKRLRRNPRDSLWYALNPLVIVEIAGNGHFEGMMLMFLLASIYYVMHNSSIKSAVLFACSIATKLIPAIFLPILFFSLKKKDWWKFFITLTISVALLFYPMVLHFIGKSGASFGLYFQNFEFNASIYYVVRQIGFWDVGYNMVKSIGPILSSLFIIVAMGFSFRAKKVDDFSLAFLLLLTAYLTLATTVHPWYVITLVGLSVLTNFKFPVVWSLLIVLSYSHYWIEISEKMWIIMAEYTLLLVAIAWDIFRNKVKLKSLIY